MKLLWAVLALLLFMLLIAALDMPTTECDGRYGDCVYVDDFGD